LLELLKLAIPVVFSTLGQMLMGVVDVAIVGRTGAAEVGAVGVGTSFFAWFLVGGLGLLSGMEYLSAHAAGRRMHEEAREILGAGLQTALAVGAAGTLALWGISYRLDLFGVNPEVIRHAGPYLRILAPSIIPALLFHALKNHLQSKTRVRPIVLTLAGANAVNLLLNGMFVLGWLNSPVLGVSGSALATLLARVLMVLVLALALRSFEGKIPVSTSPVRRRELWRLGSPLALQMTLEVGVFALSTTFASRLRPEDLAAHQIVLNLASLSFMVPLGIGSATATLAGRALGEERRADARRLGNRGIAAGTGFMVLTGLLFGLAPEPLLSLFTQKQEIIAAALPIIFWAALFQVSDGLQVSVTGALRGFAATRMPALANGIGHWGVGLPLGLWLCFTHGQGLPGLWMGLSTGLTLVGVICFAGWWRLGRLVQRAGADPMDLR